MAWYSKEQPTSLDDLQINGLCFRIGDMDALRQGCAWFEGHKKPMLALPSTTLPLEYGSDEGLSVSLGGVAYIPVFATSHEALYFLSGFRLFNCAVFEVFNDDHQIEIYAAEQQRIYCVTYDDETQQLADVRVESREPGLTR
jgi:hypothetical protein